MRAAALLALALAACAERTEAPVEAPSARCVRCHRADYQRAHHPERPAAPPPTCGVCHTQQAWRPDVSQHRYPLTGAHERAACRACHRGASPDFEATPRTCISCHRDDFARGHGGDDDAPRACADCHKTGAWTPARGGEPEPPPAPAPAPPSAPAPTQVVPAPTQPARPRPAPAREHPEARFPIERGNHEGIRCTECHSRPGANGRGNTDCVQCHPRSRYDDLHAGVGRYAQRASAPNFCVTCHGRGTRSRR